MDPVPRRTRTRTRIRIRIHIRTRIRRVPRRTRGRGGRRRAGGRGRRAGAGCGLSFRLHCRRGSSWRPRPMRTRVCGRRGASGPSRRIRRQTWMPCRDERVRSLRSRRLPTLGLPIGMLCYPPTRKNAGPRHQGQGKSAGSGRGHQERRRAGFSAGFPGLDGIPREAASTHPRSLRLGIALQRERRTRRGEARHRSFGTGIITRFRAPGRRVTRRTLPSGPEP